MAATGGRRKRREGELSQHKGQPRSSKQEHSRGRSFRKRGRGAKVLEKTHLGCAVTSASESFKKKRKRKVELGFEKLNRLFTGVGLVLHMLRSTSNRELHSEWCNLRGIHLITVF